MELFRSDHRDRHQDQPLDLIDLAQLSKTHAVSTAKDFPLFLRIANFTVANITASFSSSETQIFRHGRYKIFRYSLSLIVLGTTVPKRFRSDREKIKTSIKLGHAGSAKEHTKVLFSGDSLKLVHIFSPHWKQIFLETLFWRSKTTFFQLKKTDFKLNPQGFN